MEIPEVVEQLIDEGIEVTLFKHEKHGLSFDLDSQTKSGMYLTLLDDGNMLVYGRYDEEELIDDIHIIDLLIIFRRRYHAKGFGNHVWLELAVKYDVMKVGKKVTYTYK